MALNKQKTASLFSKAAADYVTHACVQKTAAAMLIKTLDTDYQKVLDLGAGPFVNSFELKKRSDYVISMDLSKAMLTQKVTPSICADMDSLPFKDNAFDLIFSNFAMQWSQNIEIVLTEVERVLKPGGRVHFSLVCDGSLHEIDRAFSVLETGSHINSFTSFKELDRIISTSNLKPISSTQCIHKQYFDSPACAIKSIKQIGANNHEQGAQKGLFGKSQFKRVLNAYPMEKGQFPVSYAVAYIVLEKP